MKYEKRQFVVLPNCRLPFLGKCFIPKATDFVFALFSRRGKIAENNKNVQRMTLNSKGLFSHCFRKKKNQQLEFLLSC